MTKRGLGTAFASAAISILLLGSLLSAPVDGASRSVNLTITILYDNNVYDTRLEADWGFAALIEYGEHTILFDTGNDGPRLLANMETLGIDPRSIEIVVLSHNHGDHTNGLASLLDAGISPTLYVPASFPRWYKDWMGSRCELVEVTNPIEVVPGLHSTGELVASPVEQGLVVEAARGLVVVTGCAHPGIVRMVERAKEVVDGEVDLVLGGFHLLSYTESRTQRVIASLQELGVRRVCPTHCTGEKAIALFAEAFGGNYLEGGVGRVIAVAGPPVDD